VVDGLVGGLVGGGGMVEGGVGGSGRRVGGMLEE